MEKSIIAKLIGCVLIWTALIVENDAKDIDKEMPKDLNKQAPIISSTASSSSSKNPINAIPMADKTTQGQNTTVQKDQKHNSNNADENRRVSSIQNNPDSNVLNNKIRIAMVETTTENSTLTPKLAALRTISIHEETTSTTSSLWIYITVGVLCVAFINFYVWYRKRAATYSFAPTTKTRR